MWILFDNHPYISAIVIVCVLLTICYVAEQVMMGKVAMRDIELQKEQLKEHNHYDKDN